ncbi:uncharacterized protein BJ212DRAFT_1349680 [Suillus subaureus]|uniref:Zona occludens toxin N-terminal domain-containing protein n=1 Tax=Suillus subaureus TaxID=48587 RepID=A0A9P7JE60_9AGAM|nr:uncharacterized protein BJ212DRAFT_1349680 [Suillus subaureus]KAG1817521.1 hypothetical protein BJ212DRAFT_1349680 [Suillus subaureus]
MFVFSAERPELTPPPSGTVTRSQAGKVTSRKAVARQPSRQPPLASGVASAIRKTSTSTKPVPFTFRTNLPSRTDRSTPGTTLSPKAAKSAKTEGLHVAKDGNIDTCVEPAEAIDEPIYDLDTVKAAKVELKHLQSLTVDTSDLSKDHELQTAPLITREAYITARYKKHSTQYGVMGQVLSIHSKSSAYVPVDPRLYVNTNTPFTAVVCGVQGSGKSHTVSVLLENMLIPKLQEIGSLQQPLAGLVLHFGEGGICSLPSEAAWVGAPSTEGVRTPKVRVFVSKSSLNTMKGVYAPLGKNVEVIPLLFNETELDAQAFLSMMAVGSSDSAPLYIQIVLSILRDLGERFSYNLFMERLDEEKRTFNPAQIAGLEQRLTLLNSFMESNRPQPATFGSRTYANISGPRSNVIARKSTSRRFAAGQLTIVDLSDPFIDPGSACGLFEIVTRLFVRAEVETGKVLVVDEAHKYLSTNRGVSGLTKALLTLTREQRHLGMRVIISTQEPTVVPPVLLDLCTVAIMHRFSSPAWWDHLARHISADVSVDAAFDTIVELQTGQAIVLAPSGLGVFPQDAEIPGRRRAEGDTPTVLKMSQFGRRYLIMKTRARVTKDGGTSVLVVPRQEESEESESEEEASNYE